MPPGGRPADVHLCLSERPQHRRPRRQVFDFSEIEIDGALQESLLQRVDVAAVQAARKQERDRGADDRERQHRGRPRGRHHAEQHEPEKAARDRVAQPVEADVDDRLHRAFLGPRDGREEQLVAGAEQRAPEDALARAHHEHACCARREQSSGAAQHERHRRRSGGRRKAPSFEHEAARRCLHGERDEPGRGIVDCKKSQQAVAAAERLGDGRFEHVIGQSRAGRDDQRQRREVTQIRRLDEHAQARSNVRPLDDGNFMLRCRKAPHDPRADHVEQAEKRQQGAHAEHGTEPLGHHPAGQAAKRADAGNLAEPPLGRSRIEPLAGDEQETRPEQRPGARNVQVHQDGDPARRTIDQQPLDDKQRSADGKRDGYDDSRDEFPGYLRVHRDERDRDERRDDEDGRERRKIELSQKEGVARRLADDVLGRYNARAQHGEGHRARGCPVRAHPTTVEVRSRSGTS